MKTIKLLPLLFSLILTPLLPVTATPQPPASLAGLILELNPVRGTGIFYNAGYLSLAFSDYSNWTGIDSLGQTFSGTYTYWVSSTSSGYLVLYFETFTETMDLYFTTSSATGEYLASYPLAPYDYGEGYFALISANSKPRAPWLLCPGNGVSLGDAPSFSWMQTSPSSTWYRIYMQRNGSKYLDQWLQGTRYTPSSALAGGSYTWWVQGCNSAGLGAWSQGYTFTVPLKTPRAVTLAWPTGGAVRTGTRISYTWFSEAYADWYQLCAIKDGATFLNKWYSSNTVDYMTGITNFCYVTIGDHGGGAYSWWVRGWSPDGMGPWSSMGNFSVAGSPPQAISLESPQGFQGNASSITFTWEPDLHASWYELCLVQNGTVISDQWFSLADSILDPYSKFFAVNLPGHGSGNFTWWVRGWGPDGMGPWSSSMSYSVP